MVWLLWLAPLYAVLRHLLSPYLRARPVIAPLLLLAVSGCHEPEMPQLMQDPVLPYSGTWEYRYGDSPALADGSLAYAQPSNEDGGWRGTRLTSNPAGREGSSVLWLRTRLIGQRLSDPILYSPSIYYLYEAYLDGKLISKMGAIPPQSTPRIGGPAALFLRLPADFAGHVLCVRVYSQYSTLGISAPILLASRMELLLFLMERHYAKPLVGFVLISFSIVALVTYLIRRREKSFLYFFWFTIAAGLFVWVNRNPPRYLLLGQPHIWWTIELSSLSCIGLFICGFFENVFGLGPWRLNRRFKWAYIIFIGSATAAVALRLAPAVFFLTYLQILLLITVVYLSIYCVILAWLGNINARIFGIGFFIAGLPVIYDLLTQLRILPGEIDSSAFSVLIVVLTLIVVQSRRFLALNKRLFNLSALLQLNLASASQLDDAQQAQIALTQVLQLLPVRRATLFLTQPDQESLKWVSSQDADRQSELQPSEAEGGLARAVVARGRSLTGRTGSPASSAAGAKTARLVGMPLRGQGQLVGVLCIELHEGLDSLSGDAGELLAWLSNQFGLSLMTSRALRLEIASALDRRRLTEQSELLEAAARMAAGDLESPIATVASSELSSLAQALENMRRDLQRKFQTLEEYNQEIRALNEALRSQIDHRSRRVLDLALKREGQRESRTAHFPAGAPLGELYTVARLLGQGTMGSVYEVQRTTDGRHLAAKVLTPRADKLTMVRFAREAQLMARLKHPNLISIVDVDVTDSGILFLVMELILGTTLKLCRSQYGDLSFALPVLRQIADGLAAIHAAGIVHRDLKPANVLIAESATSDATPLVKLVDFGISTLATAENPAEDAQPMAGRWALNPFSSSEHGVLGSKQAAGAGLAVPLDQPSLGGMTVGTPMYMAPETAERTRWAQPATDIWSFGVLAFELLTGELPFSIPPPLASAGELQDMPRFMERRPDMSAPVAELLQRCLLVEPSQRPTAAALASVLANA